MMEKVWGIKEKGFDGSDVSPDAIEALKNVR